MPHVEPIADTAAISHCPPVAVPLDYEETHALIGVDAIRVRDGHNPRRFFDPAKMEELIASVRRQGVLQPIVVRPAQGGIFEVIAGERRWRAAKAAGLTEIPVVMRDVDDATAAEIALVENTHRDDLAPSEEAQKARDMLTLCNGDAEEARNRLGWTKQRMDARLALLHCTPAVLEALDTRRISLGHGELLATLPPETQDGTMASILEKGITVAQLREKVGQIARPLDAAIFDRAGCAQCAHNSSVQADLFGESIGQGRCANPKCYGEKTVSALEAKKVTLAETYAFVALDIERTPDSYGVIEIEGAHGVGKIQFEQGCRACARYGVVVCTQPGREGHLTEDVCFDTGNCREGKIAAHAQLLKGDAGAVAGKSVTPPRKAADGAAAGEAPSKQAKQNAAPASTPQRVLDVIEAGLRAVSGAVALEDARVVRAVTLYALWQDAGFPGSDTTGCPELGTLTKIRESDIATLTRLDVQTCERLQQVLAAQVLSSALIGGAGARVAAAVIAATDTDLQGRFTVTAELLKAHRKAGMIALLEETGFAEWYEAQNGAATFARFAQGKIDEIIDSALKPGGFDWSGVVPKIVKTRLKSLSRS